MWACVKPASTAVMIGNGASSPARWGDSSPATAVSASTSAAVTASRQASRSGPGSACSFSGVIRCRATLPAATAASDRAVLTASGGSTAANAKVPAPNAAQPAASATAVPCRRAASA